MLTATMSPASRYTLFLQDYQREALKAVKERDGVSESEQIRRALDEWHAKRGIVKAAKPTRAKRAGKA